MFNYIPTYISTYIPVYIPIPISTPTVLDLHRSQVQLAAEAPGGAGHRTAARLGRGPAPGGEAAEGQGAPGRRWHWGNKMALGKSISWSKCTDCIDVFFLGGASLSKCKERCELFFCTV